MQKLPPFGSPPVTLFDDNDKTTKMTPPVTSLGRRQLFEVTINQSNA
jgi:hypothetical protein